MPHVELLNDTTAIAYMYSKQSIWTKSQLVCFIDIGHSKTTVSLTRFDEKEAHVLNHWSDSNLGGRDLDRAVTLELAKEFEQ